MEKRNEYGRDWDTLVVGAGAAGCMAAIAAAGQGQRVLLLEKNEKIGKKLYLTGKGRCNLTNLADTNEILENIPTNAKFLYGALHALSSHQLMAFFEQAGCPLKAERGGRVFPRSDKSSDILKTLEKQLAIAGATVRKKEIVRELMMAENAGERRVVGVRLSSGESILAGRVILAAGGLAYPATGSTGDGYRLAAQAGHSMEETVPGLVPLETAERDFAAAAPLLLKNIGFRLVEGKKLLFSGQGEIQFTPFGLGSALALSASSYLPKRPAAVKGVIDLKPALSPEMLEDRLVRELAAQPDQTVETAWASLLPHKLLLLFFQRCGLAAEKPAAQISKKERQAMAAGLKGLEFEIKGTRDFTEAIITRGGVRVKEINPKTMESKLAKGLYLAGEMIDVDALTGGFNLQIAFSTGYLAGIQPCPDKEKK